MSKVIAKFTGRSLLLAMLSGMAAVTFAQPIPGQYIAVFKPDVPNPATAARELENQHGLHVSYVYQNSIRGFAFAGDEQAAQALARNPRIAYIEQDQLAHASQAAEPMLPTGVRRIGLDLGLVGAISPVNASIAILDTGLQRDHPDLNVDPAGVRIITKTVKGKVQYTTDNNFDDDNGHGTHVGGTAAANGAIVGVAPGAWLTAVKVLGASGSGSYSIIIAGVDWVAGQPAGRFDVANMSLGGGFSQAVNDSVAAAVAKGIVFVVAAGNAASDVSQMSPASEPSAITVSAMVDYDGAPGRLGVGNYVSCKNSDGTGGTSHLDEAFPCFSNYGAGVDICAPGVLIDSTWPTSLISSGYHTISGTSMAAPHVAGAAALYIALHRASQAEPMPSVKDVTDALISSGWRVGDYGYFDYYTRDSSSARPTGDKDSIREPLLNVASLLGASARPEPDFAVTITSPADAHSFPSSTAISFSGTASLDSADVTSSLVWISNIDGVIGAGGSVEATLSDGSHTIVASVPDSVSTFGGAASITLVSGQPTQAPKQLFVAVSFDKPGDVPVYFDGETMRSYFDVTDEVGAAVPDAWVSAVMKTPAGGTLTASGATDASGRFEAAAKMNGKRGGGYGFYTITGSATKAEYLRSAEATRSFELRR